MGVLTRGLAIIEYALIAADGTVGTAWRTLGETDRDSAVTQVEADPTKDMLYSHEKDTPKDVEYTAGEKPVIFSLLDPSLEARAILTGGTIVGTGNAAVLNMPSARVPFKCALRVLPRKGDIYKANHCLLWGKKNSNYAKDSKVLWDVVADIMQPTNPAVPAEVEGPRVESIRGAVATVTIVSAGTGYTNGTVTGVPLVGGAGEYAVATIVIASGAVTTVTITSGGRNYHVGSVLTAPSLVGGTGFECVIATVA